MMNQKGIKALQVELVSALQAESKANEKAKQAQAAYDEKLAIFDSESREADVLFRANKEKALYKDAAKKVKALATKELGIQFRDDLPEGFIQKRKMVTEYVRKEMRRAALTHFHHLLVLDEKAVDKFLTDNSKEQKGDTYLKVSESITDFVTADVCYKPLPNISNATLLKLDKP